MKQIGCRCRRSLSEERIRTASEALQGDAIANLRSRACNAVRNEKRLAGTHRQPFDCLVAKGGIEPPTQGFSVLPYKHDFISNQALATHATVREQRHEGWNEPNEAKKRYDIATAPILQRVGSRSGEDDRQPAVFPRPWRGFDDDLYVASKLDQTVHQSALGNTAEPPAQQVG